MVYILCMCINTTWHFPVSCSYEACEFCCCLLWADMVSSAVLHTIPHYFCSLSGLLDFLTCHSSSLRPAPTTVGFFSQIKLRHLENGWQKPKTGRGRAIPCCHCNKQTSLTIEAQGQKCIIRNFTLFWMPLCPMRIYKCSACKSKDYPIKSC